MKDNIVEAVIVKHRKRVEKGINSYGVTMDRNDLTQKEWLIHAQEEAMDLAIYLEKIIQNIDN